MSTLEVLRCIALLFVVTIHVVAIPIQNWSVNQGIWYPAYAITYIVGNFGVPLFLMISGSLLLDPKRDISLEKLYKKMIPRILLPLLFFGYSFALMEIFFDTHRITSSMFMEGALRVLNKQSWGHLWYLYLLIGIYLVLPIIRMTLNKALNVYLLHWPYPFLWRYQWRKMEELYQKGKCDAIGVCNFDKNMIKKLLKICKIKPFVNQIERHPFFQQNEIVEYSKSNGIRIMCYSPVARMDKEMLSNEVLCSLSHKYNKTISQIILRWDIQHNDIPIPGSSSETHILENINVFDFSLTDSEVKMIDSLECGKRIRFDPRKRFTLKEKFRFLALRIKLRIEGNK